MDSKDVACLAIAGSDPGGGAGIQADLRTFRALGTAGLSAVTALTVQDSTGVRAVHPVEPSVVTAQIEVILADIPAAAVKIGMLGGEGQVRAVASILRMQGVPNIVLDPILAATSGYPLLDEAGRRAVIDELLPLCDLVTPNLTEARELAGLPPCSGRDGMQEAGETLLGMGARCVLIKGGHLQGNPTDLLLTRQGGIRWFPGDRVHTPHTHGTGCLLSAAITALLARGFTLEEAVQLAKRLLTGALRSPVAVGKGRGYPDAFSQHWAQEGARADLADPVNERSHADRLSRLSGLYVLTSSDLHPDRSHEEIARAALAAGVTAIQLRAKELPTRKLVQLASQLNRLARQAGAILIVNDRVDIALATDADGVHLGPDDMHPAEARLLLGPERIIGVSVSSVEEARPLAPFASYLGVGAIFGSRTKDDAGAPAGLTRITEMRKAFSDHTIVAIGGIAPDNIVATAVAGADAAAAISAVVCSPDMEAAAQQLSRSFLAAKAARREAALC